MGDDRKLDIFLSSAGALPEGEHDWSNVLVIGEHKSNPNEDLLDRRYPWGPEGIRGHRGPRGQACRRG
jgi:hypothetical protein